MNNAAHLYSAKEVEKPECCRKKKIVWKNETKMQFAAFACQHLWNMVV